MRYICESCIVNVILKQHLLDNTVSNDCTYCEVKSTRVINSAELVAFAGNRLEKSLYSIEDATSFEAGMFWEGSDAISFNEVAYIIQDLEIGPEEFVDELADYVLSISSSEANLFVLNDGDHDNNSYQSKWSSFISSIAHQHRFFNKEAKVFLDSLFDLIIDKSKVRNEVVTTIDRSTKLFRARVANNESTRKKIISDPSAELGPVPRHLAGEQRMTPTGISALYCSLDRRTCFSEIRAVTGDMIFSGSFKPIDELALLDLSKIHKLSQLEIDPFDLHYTDTSNKSVFIKDLMFLMSRPASKSSTPDYLSTQIIFEYLSVKFSDSLSGLMFDSVQTNGKGKNVVFFPLYSKVKQSLLNKENVESISEYRYDLIESDKYTYDIKKIEDDFNVNVINDVKLEFIEGSLLASSVKAVVTETQEFDISINFEKNNKEEHSDLINN